MTDQALGTVVLIVMVALTGLVLLLVAYLATRLVLGTLHAIRVRNVRSPGKSEREVAVDLGLDHLSSFATSTNGTGSKHEDVAP